MKKEILKLELLISLTTFVINASNMKRAHKHFNDVIKFSCLIYIYMQYDHFAL